MNYFLRCLPIVAVIVFGALTVLTVSNKEKKLSPILEANVDALATDESGGVSYICYTTFTPADWFHEDQYFINCYSCAPDKGRGLRDKSSCN